MPTVTALYTGLCILLLLFLALRVVVVRRRERIGLGTGGSHVPLAMGFDRAQARRMLRFSGNAQTTTADWQRLSEALLALNQQWKKESDPSSDSDALTRIIDISDY